MKDERSAALRAFCERAYARFHRPDFIAPDPLEVVREYPATNDREVVGLIASSLALGRVDGIVAAVREVVDLLCEGGPRACSPAEAILSRQPDEFTRVFSGFRYRFFDSEQIAGLAMGIRSVLLEYGSLEEGLAAGLGSDGVLTGLGHLIDLLVAGARGRLDRSIMLARPDRGSACKRLLLYLRWMVRSDTVDPGGWSVVGPESLLVPVDTHVLKLARRLGLTLRRQASLLVSREITNAFRTISPDDPVRYDFCLTRPGIHPLLDEQRFIEESVHTEGAIFATLG